MRTFRRRQAAPQHGARSARTPGAFENVEVAEANRAAVAKTLGASVQPKFVLGAPDDAQERDADRFAAGVMGPTPAPPATETLQRKCADCAEEDDKDEVRRKEDASGGASSHAVADTTAASIASARGGGKPLPPGERSFFETRTGAPLDHVRVHADDEAARLSARLSARAFTVGRDVFFGAGEYRPGDTGGRWLLAHELAHVGQQGHGTIRRWELGRANPPPEDWQVVTDAVQLERLERAEAIVQGLIASPRCRNYFRANCDNGDEGSLRRAFDNARVYLRPHEDGTFGVSFPNTGEMAFNPPAARIGHHFLAASLLHELGHICAPGRAQGQADERIAETAVERCRLYTPWIMSVRPRRAAVGEKVVITGSSFGARRNPAVDSVRIGDVEAPIVRWGWAPAVLTTSVRIEITVPAGAQSGPLVVFNNRVASNAVDFVVL